MPKKDENSNAVNANQVLIGLVVIKILYSLVREYSKNTLDVSIVLAGIAIAGFFVYLFKNRIKWAYYLQAALSGLNIFFIFTDMAGFGISLTAHSIASLIFSGIFLGLSYYIIKNYKSLKKK